MRIISKQGEESQLINLIVNRYFMPRLYELLLYTIDYQLPSQISYGIGENLKLNTNDIKLDNCHFASEKAIVVIEYLKNKFDNITINVDGIDNLRLNPNKFAVARFLTDIRKISEIVHIVFSRAQPERETNEWLKTDFPRIFELID